MCVHRVSDIKRLETQSPFVRQEKALSDPSLTSETGPVWREPVALHHAGRSTSQKTRYSLCQSRRTEDDRL